MMVRLIKLIACAFVAPLMPLALRVWPFEGRRAWNTPGGFASNDSGLFGEWMTVERTLQSWGMPDDGIRATIREAIAKDLKPVDVLALSIEYYVIDCGECDVEEEVPLEEEVEPEEE